MREASIDAGGNCLGIDLAQLLCCSAPHGTLIHSIHAPAPLLCWCGEALPTIAHDAPRTGSSCLQRSRRAASGGQCDLCGIPRMYSCAGFLRGSSSCCSGRGFADWVTDDAQCPPALGGGGNYRPRCPHGKGQQWNAPFGDCEDHQDTKGNGDSQQGRTAMIHRRPGCVARDLEPPLLQKQIHHTDSVSTTPGPAW